MNFEEQIRALVGRVNSLKEVIQTEEATKTSLVMPFFQILGYDVFNPNEFTPEFTADVGIKKGEKVDYAILSNEEPMILIECKSINEVLEKHDSQLFRYFGTTAAKFAILTNGAIYRFYTDLETPNKMDNQPFLEVNLLNLKDVHIVELKKFHKENFDLNSIKDTAADLKYLGLIQSVLKDTFANPNDEFVRFVLGSGVYEGMKTQNVIDKYSPLVKKSLTLYINELVNEKIQSALKVGEEPPAVEIETEPILADEPEIITTQEEMEAYFIVKALLRGEVDIDRVTYKDTLSYFGVLLDDKVTRWICRLYFKESVAYAVIRNIDNQDIRYDLESLNDIYKLKDQLMARVKELL